MDTEVTILAGILDLIKDDQNATKKGELKFKSSFVLELRIDDYPTTAKVRASLKDKCYAISLNVDGTGGIKGANCESPRGQWTCTHMAAVSNYPNKKERSKTDLPSSQIYDQKRLPNKT